MLLLHVLLLLLFAQVNSTILSYHKIHAESNDLSNPILEGGTFGRGSGGNDDLNNDGIMEYFVGDFRMYFLYYCEFILDVY